jgi:hypothetical protein
MRSASGTKAGQDQRGANLFSGRLEGVRERCSVTPAGALEQPRRAGAEPGGRESTSLGKQVSR